MNKQDIFLQMLFDFQVGKVGPMETYDKVSALFKHGVCADCKHIGYWYCPHEFMGEIDVDKDYCSEFEPKEQQ